MVDDYLINVKNLSVSYKVYGGYLKVLDDINFYVKKNERVGIIGETGCGKTTTMKTILRLQAGNAIITNGEIEMENGNILKMDDKQFHSFRKKKMAMIFQEPMIALNPVFTIGQQINDVIIHASDVKLSKEDIDKKARDVISSVSLPDADRILNNYPFQLSGGMRQRVCIALAISMAQQLLIADEPTTALDVTIQAQILELIDKIAKKKKMSLILITHSLGLTRNTTDRMYVMYAGSMIETSPTKRLYENPLHPYTIGLLNSIPRITGKQFSDGIPGRLPNYLNPSPGCRFQDRCTKAMDICRKKKPIPVEVEPGHWVSCFLFDQKKDI